MAERVCWKDLPAALRKAVEDRTGKVLSSEPISEGLNCSVALAVTTKDDGRLFLKGVRDSDAKGVTGLLYEEKISESGVAGTGPQVHHSFRAGGWYCLAFTFIEGRYADLGPGSEDLKPVAFTIRRLEELHLPSIPIPQFADRFARFLEPGEAERLAGKSLLHTDTNPFNIMIDAEHVAYVIDWAMPAIGPSWIDPAYTAVRLMECGHAPHSALSWLSEFTNWRRADPKAVEAFVNITCRRWTATIGEKDAEQSNARFRHLLDFLHEAPGRSGRRRRQPRTA